MQGECSRACEASSVDRLSVGAFVGLDALRSTHRLLEVGVCSRASEAGSFDRLSVGAFVGLVADPGPKPTRSNKAYYSRSVVVITLYRYYRHVRNCASDFFFALRKPSIVYSFVFDRPRPPSGGTRAKFLE